MSEDYSLKDLLINEINVQEIIAAIKEEYNISYTKDKVEQMTMKRFVDINIIKCIKQINKSPRLL